MVSELGLMSSMPIKEKEQKNDKAQRKNMKSILLLKQNKEGWLMALTLSLR